MARLDPTTTVSALEQCADDLLIAARAGDRDALASMRGCSDDAGPTGSRHALAQRFHAASWQRLRNEVLRRELLDARDETALRAQLVDFPDLARAKLSGWADIPSRLRPLGYLSRSPRDGTPEIARLLLSFGAPVDGGPGDPEPPLVSAARVGDAALVAVLVVGGADLEAVASPSAPGIAEGTALLHAAVYGHTAALDVLVRSGARILGLGTAAAAGDLRGWSVSRATPQSRIDALVFAADHERLDVIDQLLDAGTPIDAEDEVWGRQALRTAHRNGRRASVEHLLARGADPGVLALCG